MLTQKISKNFKKDIKKAHRQKKDLELLAKIMRDIIFQKQLDPIYQDHPLKGSWKGCRDCHITNDWVLIYRLLLDEQAVIFERLGSHAELFK
jgi:mRNA interferase YafQ